MISLSNTNLLLFLFSSVAYDLDLFLISNNKSIKAKIYDKTPIDLDVKPNKEIKIHKGEGDVVFKIKNNNNVIKFIKTELERNEKINFNKKSWLNGSFSSNTMNYLLEFDKNNLDEFNLNCFYQDFKIYSNKTEKLNYPKSIWKFNYNQLIYEHNSGNSKKIITIYNDNIIIFEHFFYDTYKKTVYKFSDNFEMLISKDFCLSNNNKDGNKSIENYIRIGSKIDRKNNKWDKYLIKKKDLKGDSENYLFLNRE